ncbi:hypothetical protein G4V62_18190 [Bacillaceae bacterium SIJ1]|uniref:tetratricopeptide repeat protein n=1 Tax=Litoribacterium kuwaitense TaxID=1398745 RepID=UPI0013EE251B|nr:hypothetical protein [Litoribacterium kuwaitense]NGP46776.1 hypothetical protein [Litoribacterium kuwaitense]
MIHVIDDHDEAYYIWKENNISKATLLHIDAHSDIQDEKELHIGSFIRHAINTNIVNSYYWIIPKDFHKNKFRHTEVLLHLQFNGTQNIKVLKNGVITGKLNDCEIWVGPYDLLPKINEPVLLDIDIDYFITSPTFVGYKESLSIWEQPKELIRFLEKNNILNKIITICTSIQGGYTPFQWKCLADYIQFLITENKELFPIDKLSKGACLFHNNQYEYARKYFLSLLNENEYTMEGSYVLAIKSWLARIEVELKNEIYQFDYDYKNNYWICPGFAYFYNRKYDIASEYFRDWDNIYKNNTIFNFAKAKCIKNKNISFAIQLCKNSIFLNSEYIDPYILLGDIYMKKETI